MRKLDAAHRLAEWIETEARTPNPYGAFVCAMSSADCVREQTDEDPAAEYRGIDFANSLEAARILARFGGSLEALVTAFLKREPKHPALATAGDVVLAEIEIEDGRGDCIGICLGNVLRFRTQIGIVKRPAFVRREDGTLAPLARLAWSIE
jgi:hypothetical protein